MYFFDCQPATSASNIYIYIYIHSSSNRASRYLSLSAAVQMGFLAQNYPCIETGSGGRDTLDINAVNPHLRSSSQSKMPSLINVPSTPVQPPFSTTILNHHSQQEFPTRNFRKNRQESWCNGSPGHQCKQSFIELMDASGGLEVGH